MVAVSPVVVRSGYIDDMSRSSDIEVLQNLATGAAAQPSAAQAQAGGGTGSFGESGVLITDVNAAGVQPSGTAADKILAIYTIPANTFSAANKQVQITACGAFGATGNNKTVKLIANATSPVVGNTVSGGTTIATTGVSAQNGGGWSVSAAIVKFGAANSNTQIAVHAPSVPGTLAAPTTNLTLTENAAITVCVTGNAATAATDITYNFGEVVMSN
jgi:hypothetical protein